MASLSKSHHGAAPSVPIMESLYAIALGLGLRFIVGAATHHDFRVTVTIVGLWEGLVLNHFILKMPSSFDPYVAYGVRLFVDLVVTESFARLFAVLLWSGLGWVLADADILNLLPYERSTPRVRFRHRTSRIPLKTPPSADEISDTQPVSAPRPKTPGVFPSRQMGALPMTAVPIPTSPSTMSPRIYPLPIPTEIQRPRSPGSVIERNIYEAQEESEDDRSFFSSPESDIPLSQVIRVHPPSEVDASMHDDAGQTYDDHSVAGDSKASPVLVHRMLMRSDEFSDTRSESQGRDEGSNSSTPEARVLLPTDLHDEAVVTYASRDMARPQPSVETFLRPVEETDGPGGYYPTPAIEAGYYPNNHAQQYREETPPLNDIVPAEEKAVNSPDQRPWNLPTPREPAWNLYTQHNIQVPRVSLFDNEDLADDSFYDRDRTPTIHTMPLAHVDPEATSPRSHIGLELLETPITLADSVDPIRGSYSLTSFETAKNPPSYSTRLESSSSSTSELSGMPRLSAFEDRQGMRTEPPMENRLSAITESSLATGESVISNDAEDALVSRAGMLRKAAMDEEVIKADLEKEMKQAAREGRVKERMLLRFKMEDASKRAKRLHERAARRLYLADNTEQKPQTIDVHRLLSQEAIREMDRAIRNALMNGETTVRVILGPGNHAISKLKIALIRELELQKITNRIDHFNPAVLIITLPP